MTSSQNQCHQQLARIGGGVSRRQPTGPALIGPDAGSRTSSLSIGYQMIGAPIKIYNTMWTFIDYIEGNNPTITLTAVDGTGRAKVKAVRRVVPHHMEPNRGLFGWKILVIESTIASLPVGLLPEPSLYWWCDVQYPQGDARNDSIPMTGERVKVTVDGNSFAVTVELGLSPAPERLDEILRIRAEKYQWRRVLEKVYRGYREHRRVTGTDGLFGGGLQDDPNDLSDEELRTRVEFDPFLLFPRACQVPKPTPLQTVPNDGTRN